MSKTINWTAVIGSITAIIIGIVQANHGLQIEQNHEITSKGISRIEGQVAELPYLRKQTILGIVADLKRKDEAQDVLDIRQDIRLDALEREEHRHLPYLESPYIEKKDKAEEEKE